MAGIIFSSEVWFPIARTFPRAPVLFALPESLVFPFEWLFSSILVVSLISIIFSRRPRIFPAVVIFCLVLQSFFDQLHLQPWVYQYLVLFVVFWRHDWKSESEEAADETIKFAQIIIAGLYVWGGIQKMNFNFSHEILPSLLAPLHDLFPAIQIPYVFLGIVIPLTESLIGVGLFFRRTRNTAVWLAVSMNVFVLSLLIAKDYNSVVWIWNLTLIFAVVFAFWRDSDSPLKFAANGEISVRKILVAAFVALPLLNFFGYWDSFLSGNYYSGSVEIPVIRINEEVFAKLPPTAQSTVFQTNGTGEKMLPLFEWSIVDTNAPVCLEQRIFRQIAREVCQLATDKDQVELIIRERPAILDGKSKVTVFSCRQIENAD